MLRFLQLCATIWMVFLAAPGVRGEQSGGEWMAGFARVDVTPREPVRMAGYGSRDHPSEGVDTKLYVRAISMKSEAQSEPCVLLSVDTIGLPGSMTRELAEQIAKTHAIPREKIVFCSTHTHAGPDLVSELSNIFSKELTEEEVAAGNRYKQQLKEAILKAVALSIEDLQPSSLSHALGEATFAANRRVLTNGRWTGFGVQPDGPVDHSVNVLRISDSQGEVRGIVFNYACHCTTLGGDHYQINGDWAGYAAANLEATFPGTTALSTIGCGADANPEPRGTLDATKIHGRTLAAEVTRVVRGDMSSITSPIEPRFDYAALTFDLPTQEELEARRTSSQPQTRRHAEQLLGVLEEHGRLPATYPVPIQSWQFGDQLTMIFLGGEVVVDYALRLKKSLDDSDLWVTAYANDVLGYIASERMRSEGGYEYDRSGVYYGLPGPWATGTEDLLVSRIEDMLQSRGRSRPTPAEDASSTFRLTDGFSIQLVAAEPLVQDPVNIAFDASGRLWVVEMGDYPEGVNGGRVKVLQDTDADGVYDVANTFMDELPFPTGVMPWRDGVLISAAPDILFARDCDGDGRADDVQKLYTGFRLANPQHRINGFTYGLDHSLHLASGDNLSKITSSKTGESVDASGHDVQIWPDSGQIAATSGRTQFVRSRNDWGEWFGNDNSRPMYQFPIDDAYAQRNPHTGYAGGSHQLFDPPVAPPIFPITAISERFNDLFAAGRFTSACSAIVARSPHYALAEGDAALICEPVHNLVHRAALVQTGSVYQAARSEAEIASEFLASSDPWFRPVRALIGPDGLLYVVDMYRETIEHPEWIPEAWQAQLDLRAGEDRGRIYRVKPITGASTVPNKLASLSKQQLVQQLRSPIGARRDLAQQLLIERFDPGIVPSLIEVAGSDESPHGRVHALSILEVTDHLEDDLLLSALESSHPGVLMVAIRISESRLVTESEGDSGSRVGSQASDRTLRKLARLAEHDDQRVVLRVALAVGQTAKPQAGEILSRIARSGQVDDWVGRAISSSSSHHAAAILAALTGEGEKESSVEPAIAKIPVPLLTSLLATAKANGIDIANEYGDVFSDASVDVSTQLKLAASFTSALDPNDDDSGVITDLLRPLYARAIELIRDEDREEQQRCDALHLVGIGIESADNEKELLLELLSPKTPSVVQQRAVDQLARFSDAETCQSMVARWGAMTKSVRDHFVGRMLERRRWTEQLLSALEREQILAKELTPASRQRLAHTGSRSMRVRAARLTRATSSLEKRQLIRSYLSEMVGGGDSKRGEALFTQHCAVCHVSNSQGQAVGASLDNLSDRSPPALVTAILDPNRAVDPKYHSYVIRTDDDRILAGAIESEVGQSITLAHADGKRTTVLRDEIVDMKNSGVSLMPEGMEDVLKPDAMNDVIAYLQTMNRKP